MSEFHCAKYRAKTLLILGVFYATTNIMMPLLAWAVLPQNIEIYIFNGLGIIHFKCNLQSLYYFFFQYGIPGIFIFSFYLLQAYTAVLHIVLYQKVQNF